MAGRGKKVWSDEMERELIRLWGESERKNEKKMITKRKQRDWIIRKLSSFAADDSAIPNDSAVKNKVEGIRKK